MTIIHLTLLRDEGSPLPARTLRYSLCALIDGAVTEVAGRLPGGRAVMGVMASSDAAGLVAVDLPPNSTIIPAGTFYVASRLPRGGDLSFIVPDAPGPLDLLDLLTVSPPQPVMPVAVAGAHAVSATGATTIAAINNGVYEVTAAAGAAVALTGAPGTQCAIMWTGGAGTVEGVAIDDGGVVVAVRLSSGWRVFPVGGAAAEVVVVPTAPTMDDDADTYTVPTTAGVLYKVGGVTVAAGTYSVGDVTTTVVVTAVAAAGYALSGTTSWALLFTVASAYTRIAADTFAGTGTLDDAPLSDGTHTWGVRTSRAAALIKGGGWLYCDGAASNTLTSEYGPAPASSAAGDALAVRLAFDYDSLVHAGYNASYDGYISIFDFGAVIDNDYGFRLVLGKNPGLVAIGDRAGSNPITMESGVTLPLAGAFVYECIGTAVTYKVDGTLIATQNRPGTRLLAAQKGVLLARGAGPALGVTARIRNWVLEVQT